MIRKLILTASLTLATGLPALAQQPAPPRGQFRPAPAIEKPADFAAPRDFALMPSSQPVSIIPASGGVIWFSAFNLGALGRLNRATGEVTYYPLGTGARPYAIVEAADRSIIATDRALNVLHRLNPETGEATRIAMPPDLPFLDLAQVRVDVEGRIWFCGASGWLGSHDLATGQTEVTSHDDLLGLAFSATAPNGALWFVASRSGRMIRLDPHRTRFDSAALPANFMGVRGVSVGPNGEVWIASMMRNALARYTGRGLWMTANLPWPDSRPQAMVVRADGSVIVADTGRRKLLRYRPNADRFDIVGDLGSGGNIKSMIDLGDGVAIADMGADRIRFFPDEIPISQ